MRFRIIFVFLLALFLTGCQQKQIMQPQNILTKKTAILVVAFNGFQDEEYKTTRRVLEGAGLKILVASSSLGEATGKNGLLVDVDLLLDDVKIDDTDALVFIGGPGTEEYFENRTVHFLVKETVKKNKILAAICIAPEILVKAGVLDGRKATIWSSFVDRSTIDALKRGGAIYIDQDVVIDGQIVTANGPAAAEKFGQAIVDLLSH